MDTSGWCRVPPLDSYKRPGLTHNPAQNQSVSIAPIPSLLDTLNDNQTWKQAPYRGRPAGSWWLWQSHSHSWPGYCRQTYSQFLPCKTPRGWKPLLAWGFHSPWYLGDGRKRGGGGKGLIRKQTDGDIQKCISIQKKAMYTYMYIRIYIYIYIFC